MSQAASSAATKKKFETCLNYLFRQPILTESSVESFTVLTKPTADSCSFFEQKNTSGAKSYLHHKVIVKLSLPIYTPAGLVTAVWAGIVFWDRQDSPSNFSFFFVPAQSASMISDTADVISLSLKTSDSREGMDSEDIRRLTKQKVYIPISIYKLEHHVNHGIHLLRIFFGAMSFLITQLRSC